MPHDPALPLYDLPAFRERFMQPASAGLPPQAGRFFAARLEEFYPLVRQAVPPMRSPAHTALFVTSGAAVMALGCDGYVVRENELLLVPAGQVFSFRPGDRNTGYLCHFHPDLLLPVAAAERPSDGAELLTAWSQPLVRFEPAAAAFARELLERLLAVYQEAGLRALGLLQPHLGALLAEARWAHRLPAAAAPSAAAALALAFKRLVNARVTQTHQVADYAEWLHVTPNHLNKAVRTATGRPPTAWLNEALVLEAKVLLFQTDLPIAEVAARVGVSDASYFSRLFKKAEGHTPSELRRRLLRSGS